MRLLTLLTTAPLVFLACAEPPAEVATPPRQVADHGEIEWFDGTVEEAFATAKAEGRPVFLYWGAVWCPPCHYLKDKIFTRPEFIEQSREFVAVYLDGDTERAQSWGDEFGVFGYPTVIVLNPQGEEVVRMSADVPVDEYARALDAALARLRPLPEILEETLAAEPGQADPEALRLLAHHSWDQDRTFDVEDREAFETFAALHAATPESMPVERSRFLALMLEEASRAAAENNAGEPLFQADRLPAVRAELEELLTDPTLRNSNVFFVVSGAPRIIELLEPEPGPEREALTTLWSEAGVALEEDESLPVLERLWGIKVRIALARMEADEPPEGEGPARVPDEVLDHLRERIAWANEAVTDEGELQGVMNTMAGLLMDVGLLDEAERLIAERLDDTESPYYYMRSLARLREEAGDTDGALEWSRRAWEGSRGAATRFEWGSGHVLKLIQLAPDDVERIEAISLDVLDELLATEDPFTGRNQFVLEALEASYREWADGGERAAAVERIRNRVLAACDLGTESTGDDSARARCEAFLASEESA